MTVSGAVMPGASSFSKRAGIPSSPVPFDVLSSLSWRWTNAADTGFKENKDWLELIKHASVLSWFQLRGGILESRNSCIWTCVIRCLSCELGGKNDLSRPLLSLSRLTTKGCFFRELSFQFEVHGYQPRARNRFWSSTTHYRHPDTYWGCARRQMTDLH